MTAGTTPSGDSVPTCFRPGLPPQLARTHLIGIGGAGISGVARIVLARGGAVSGSDAKDSAALLALRALGAKVAVGHAAANLDQLGADATAIISTKAVHQIDPHNPELIEGARRGIPVIHRSAALAALMTGYRIACITGTAGKTSTTSMLTVALQHCGADPSFLIGGDLVSSGPVPTTAAAISSWPRPTRVTAPSWPTPQTLPWSRMSRPTTWTTTALSRPTPPASTPSWPG